MTLCIAAKCGAFRYRGRKDAQGEPVIEEEAFDPSVVTCCDFMISTDWSGAEHGYKVESLGHNFVALTAGPVDKARELCQLYQQAVAEATTLTRANALERFTKPIGELKRRYAESHLQARIGLSYEEFQQNGREQLPSDLFSDLFRDIHAFSSGVELIIVGYFGDPYALAPFGIDADAGPAIYRVSGDTVSEVDHFACIGTGAVIAESSLYYREQQLAKSVEETLYAVYESKRLGEKAPGVGKKTAIGILKWDRSFGFTQLWVDTRKLEQYFARFSPQPISFDEPLLTEDDFIDLGAQWRQIQKSKEQSLLLKKRRPKR